MRWIAAMLAGIGIFASTAKADPIVEMPAPGVVVGQPVQAFTLSDAAYAFNHLPPGKHQVVFIHPYTGCPVTVCFNLPCGCYQVDCGKGLCAKKLTFRYKGLFNNVVLRFKKDGSVSVKDRT